MASVRPPYLVALMQELIEKGRTLAPERRARHRDVILQSRTPDGGFRGREGHSDLYYTSFALRGLVTVGDTAGFDETASFLRTHEPSQLSVVDVLSWLSSAALLELVTGESIAEDTDALAARLTERFESLRTPEGGYARTQGAQASTYQSFLVWLAYQLLGLTVPHPTRLCDFFLGRLRDDGGFAEFTVMKRSGTNPTAAAVAVLAHHDALTTDVCARVRGFLESVAAPEGGFRANSRVPIADALSSFTGFLTARS
ncbi:MAG: geranyl transferase, partial [Planctomycetota bacterium]